MASRLLNQRSGTATSWRKALDSEERALLDQMVAAGLLQIVGGEYLPTFLGIEQLDDADISGIVKGNLNCVLSALRSMYKGWDDNPFDFAAIVRESRRQGLGLDENDVLPALILGEQLAYYTFPHGIQKRDGRLIVQGATIFDRILDFTSVDDAWAKLVTQQESRRSKAAAQKDLRQRMKPEGATNIRDIIVANDRSTINTGAKIAVTSVSPAKGGKKDWWETWWGQSAVLIVTGVIAGLFIWAVSRHYDKMSPTPAAIEQPKK